MIMTKENRVVEKNDLISFDEYAKNRKKIRQELIEYKKIEEYNLVHTQHFILKALRLCVVKFKKCCT